MMHPGRTYMSTVARDMGAQPSLFRLWWTHGWFILLVYWCVQIVLWANST
jgi:hypothetical protein